MKFFFYDENSLHSPLVRSSADKVMFRFTNQQYKRQQIW